MFTEHSTFRHSGFVVPPAVVETSVILGGAQINVFFSIKEQENIKKNNYLGGAQIWSDVR